MKTNDDKEMNQTDFNQLLLEKINRIEIGLCGDEAAGITGVVQRVKQHEKKLKIFERFIWSITGALTLLSILWAVFTEFHK